MMVIKKEAHVLVGIPVHELLSIKERMAGFVSSLLYLKNVPGVGLLIGVYLMGIRSI